MKISNVVCFEWDHIEEFYIKVEQIWQRNECTSNATDINEMYGNSRSLIISIILCLIDFHMGWLFRRRWKSFVELFIKSLRYMSLSFVFDCRFGLLFIKFHNLLEENRIFHLLLFSQSLSFNSFLFGLKHLHKLICLKL